jgi:phosphohistidine swiveling domain-containing protein
MKGIALLKLHFAMIVSAVDSELVATVMQILIVLTERVHSVMTVNAVVSRKAAIVLIPTIVGLMDFVRTVSAGLSRRDATVMTQVTAALTHPIATAVDAQDFLPVSTRDIPRY